MASVARGHPRNARRAVTRVELLRLSGWGALALFATVLVVTLLMDSRTTAGCASSSIRTQVQTELARAPDASVFDLARQMRHSVAVTLDALPEDRRTGVQGSQSEAVWASLRSWPQPVLFLAAGGQSFRLHAALSEVQPDSGAGTRQLGGPGDILQGRLRLDEIGSIYAWVAGSRRELSPAVVFLDRKGEFVFVVAPGNVFEQPVATIPPEFAATLRLMQRLQPACARPERRHR